MEQSQVNYWERWLDREGAGVWNSHLERYGLAIACTGLALLARLALDPLLREHHVFPTFFLAVILTNWAFGFGPSLLSLALSIPASAWFFIPPRGTLHIQGVDQWIGLGTYITVNLVLIWYGWVRRRSEGRLTGEICRRKVAETALRESEARLRTLTAASFEGIAISENARLTDVNDQLLRMLGYSREELVGREVRDLLPPEERPAVLRNILEGRESHIDHSMFRKDGTRLVVSAHGQTVTVEGRQVRFTALRNITERKRMEERLRRSEELLTQAIRVAELGIFEHDHRTESLHWSDRTRAICGVAPEQRITLSTFVEGIHPEDRDAAIAAMHRAHDPHGDGLYTVELRFVRGDGTICWLSIRSQTFFEGAGQERRPVRTIGAIRDLTGEKEAQQALQRRNQRLALLAEAAEELLWTPNPEVSIRHLFSKLSAPLELDAYLNFLVDASGTALRLDSWTGISEEVISAVRRVEFGQGVWGTVAQQRQPIVLNDVQHSEDSLARLARSLGFRAYACFPLISGDRLLGTFSFASRRRNSFSPDDLQFLRTLAYDLAITQERAQHQRHLEQTVQERTAKLREMVAELEHMSYSIVHDLRAPLRAIQGFSALIQRQEGGRLSPRSREMFERMIASCNRMDALIMDALNYSRIVRGELPLKVLDPGDLLRTLLKSCPEFQSPFAEVCTEGEFPAVLANETALTQCFSNLLGNAVKFVQPGQLPRIRIWAEMRNPEPEVPPRPAPAGSPSAHPPFPKSFIRLWFEDNGVGIEPSFLPHIFGLFQRGTNEQAGTGIGLALVRKNMERMGGRVGVESQPGVGSRFWLDLKAANPAPH